MKLFEDRLAALAGDHIIHTSAINEQTLRELRSLGYLAGDSGREFELNGTGIDPKDRIAVLKLLEEAVAPGTRATVEERIVLLRKAQSIDPTNPEVLDQLGETYQNAHQYDKAVNTYELAIKNGVESARICSRIGNLKVRLGKRGEQRRPPGDSERSPHLPRRPDEKRRRLHVRSFRSRGAERQRRQRI